MGGFFNAKGPIAAAQGHLMITMVALMLIVVVPMFIALIIIARKYRVDEHSKRAEKDEDKDAMYEPEKRGGIWGQLILWIIPAALIVVLGVMNWQSAFSLDPYRAIPLNETAPGAHPLTIQVVALQWKWLFIYPAQNIATVNVITFPVGTPIHFELTADAPMSSFWIPQLGSQIYAMAAMETQINLLASSTGKFIGRDTEINGEGYAGMTFEADAVTPADFAAWVTSVQQTTTTYPALTPDAYATLALPSENNPHMYYSSVSGHLFDTIMMNYMMPTGTMSGMKM